MHYLSGLQIHQAAFSKRKMAHKCSVAPAKLGQPGRSKLDPFEAEILSMIEDRKDRPCQRAAQTGRA